MPRPLLLSFVLTSILVSRRMVGGTPQEGSLCMTVEHRRGVPESNQYLECLPLSDHQMSAYKINDKNAGVWNLRNCSTNEQFDRAKQSCVEKKMYRRKQAKCASDPNTVECGPSCKAADAKVSPGNACDWPFADLQADPSSKSHFLQCNRPSTSDGCGRWSRVECSPDTAFHRSLRICISVGVSSKNDSSCSQGSSPVCSCAQDAGVNACPGKATCSKGSKLCCQEAPRSSLYADAPSSLLMNQAPC